MVGEVVGAVLDHADAEIAVLLDAHGGGAGSSVHDGGGNLRPIGDPERNVKAHDMFGAGWNVQLYSQLVSSERDEVSDGLPRKFALA